MSRIIKQYPYTEEFKDEVQVSANTISTLRFPGAYIECISFSDDYDKVISLATNVWAEEDTKGIHAHVVEKDKDGNKTGKKSKEIVIDEIQFCDAIYDICREDKSAESSPFIRDIIYDLVQDFAINEMKGDLWLCGVNYDGHGIICSGEDIIGTIDRVVFEKGSLILNYCVGNINLNNIENCNIKFHTNDKHFILNDIKMQNVTSDNEFYCTYCLSDYKGTYSDEPVFDEDIFEGFVPYSPENEEQFFEQRNSLTYYDSSSESSSSGYLDELL